MKKSPEVGSTARIKVLSGEVIEGRIVHVWQDKSTLMIRVVSGSLVYNVPASVLVDQRKSK